jgi:hypothetical protein
MCLRLVNRRGKGVIAKVEVILHLGDRDDRLSSSVYIYSGTLSNLLSSLNSLLLLSLKMSQVNLAGHQVGHVGFGLMRMLIYSLLFGG